MTSNPSQKRCLPLGISFKEEEYILIQFSISAQPWLCPSRLPLDFMPTYPLIIKSVRAIERVLIYLFPQFKYLDKDEFKDLKYLRRLHLDGNQLSVIVDYLFQRQKNLLFLGEWSSRKMLSRANKLRNNFNSPQTSHVIVWQRSPVELLITCSIWPPSISRTISSRPSNGITCVTCRSCKHST